MNKNINSSFNFGWRFCKYGKERETTVRVGCRFGSLWCDGRCLCSKYYLWHAYDTCYKKITTLPLDVHLMITKPERYVEEFADAGADIITFHPEASKNPIETISLIKAKGKKQALLLMLKSRLSHIYIC